MVNKPNKRIYPYNEELDQYSCKACHNIIPFGEIDLHYHRCPYCGYNFVPENANVRFVVRDAGMRL